MAGRIPQAFIDDLLNRLDIVEVVGRRLALKRSGDNHSARCPFHDEKTPSFTVSQSKQFYHCFGCGAHGNAIGFVMQYDQLEFPAAVEDLAAGLGLEVPHEGGDSGGGEPTRELFEVLQACMERYKQALREHAPAVDYLKQRGVSGEAARDFAIGYAPAGWDNLGSVGAASATRDALQRAGMLISRERGGAYDRFRDRIMFPIRDARGRVLGFGGRAFGDDTPKYLNSPESPVFHKGREVYGLYEARRSQGRAPGPHHGGGAAGARTLIVVEGYLDVVALHQHGLPGAVATLGTAVTGDQLRRLFRETHELVFCFDGDAAGTRAAWRALETGLPLLEDGREIRIALLPEGEDPDSFLHSRGAAAFALEVQSAATASDYLLQTLKARTDMATIGGRARLAELARPLIARLPPGVYAELLTEQVAREIGGGAHALRSSMAGAPRGQAGTARPREAGPPQRMTPLRRVIALLLKAPALHTRLAADDEVVLDDAPGMALLRALLDEIRSLPQANAGLLLQRLAQHPERPALARLASWEPAAPLDEAQLAIEFDAAVVQLQRAHFNRLSDALLAASEHRDLTDEEERQLNEFIKKAKQALESTTSSKEN